MAARRTYKLDISPRALAQVENIRSFLTERNPQAAARVLQAPRLGFQTLRNRPFIGRIGDVPRTRERSGMKYPYIIVYRVLEDRGIVEIAAVFHAAQGERKL